jgi:hypothetical protein
MRSEERNKRGRFVPAFPHFIASNCVNIRVFPLGIEGSLFHTAYNYSRTLVSRTAQMLTTCISQFLRHSGSVDRTPTIAGRGLQEQKAPEGARMAQNAICGMHPASV